MSRSDYAAGGRRDGAIGAGRRGDDPALSRRENNHRDKEAADTEAAIKDSKRAKEIAREKAAGSRGNKKQPPGHARY